jgi:hypothetical protein
MTQVQLQPQFTTHPECATGVITLEIAETMIQRGMLTHEGARYLFPPKAWALLPKEELELNPTELSAGEHHDSQSVSHRCLAAIGRLFRRCCCDR